MSDNHGRWQHIDYILLTEKDANYFVHCGDNEGSDEDLQDFIAVRGNCDYRSSLPSEERFRVNGLEIGVIHGNQFGFRLSSKVLFDYMKQQEYDILFFGHTHCPYINEKNGKYLVNPGSTAKPRGGSNASYCVVWIDNDGKIEVEFKDF